MLSRVLRAIEYGLFTYKPFRDLIVRPASYLEHNDVNYEPVDRVDNAYLPIMRVSPKSWTGNLHGTSSSSTMQYEFNLELASGDGKVELLGKLHQMVLRAIQINMGRFLPPQVKKIEYTQASFVNAKDIEGVEVPMGWLFLGTFTVTMYMRSKCTNG